MCNKHLMLGQTPVIYTHTYTHSHTLNTFTQAQCSVNSHKKHTHSLKQWKPGKNVGWQGRQLVVVQRKPPVSRRNRELGRQLSCTLRKRKEISTHACTCTCASMCPRSGHCHIHSYVHTLTHIQRIHSSTVLCKQPRETRTLTEAMKARQKCRLAGPTTGYRRT